MSIIKRRLSIVGMILFFILGALSMMFFLHNMNHKGKDISSKASHVAKTAIAQGVKETHVQDAWSKPKQVHAGREYSTRSEIPKAPETKSEDNEQGETQETHDQAIAFAGKKEKVEETRPTKEPKKSSAEKALKENETTHQKMDKQENGGTTNELDKILTPGSRSEMKKKAEAEPRKGIGQAAVREIYRKRLEALNYLE